MFQLHSSKNRLVKFLDKYWFYLLILLSGSLSLLYAYPLIQPGIPSGIDTPHYYPVIVKYLKHLQEHGSLPDWFRWWYAGYPESSFNSLATLAVVYISYITKIAPALLYNLSRLLFHILLGITSGIYAHSLTRSKISAFFTTILVVSSLVLLRNCGIVGRFPTIVALPFLGLTLYFCEKQISSKKFFTKESVLFSFSLALCISIHSMVAYITLLLLFLRLVAVFIYQKNPLQALKRVIIPAVLSLPLASYSLIRLLYERSFFENLFWPSTPAESLYQVIRGHFSWILGEGHLFFGTFLIIAFILYLLNTIKRGIKEKDFFLLVSIAVLLILSWGPSDRQFLWSTLPMHTGFDNRRFALVGCLLLCVAGGIGLARLLNTREFSKIKIRLSRLFIPLLLVFAVLEALPLRSGFRPIQPSQGARQLGATLEEGSQGRIYTSGFRHFHALLVPVIYNQQLVGGWFYQGALTRDYLEPVKSFGQQVPAPRAMNYVPRDPTLFSNLLWWFNCQYIILGYDWFDKSEIGYLWDTYQPKNPFFKPIYALFKDRVIGGWPASDFHTFRLEALLQENPDYFMPHKMYGEVNAYQLTTFDDSYAFLTKNPLLFIGPEENYRQLFLALNSTEGGERLVLVRGPQELENVPQEFETVIIYGIPLEQATYDKIEALSQIHKVVFIQASSVSNDDTLSDKIEPQTEVGELEYLGQNGITQERDVILRFYDDFFSYYSLEKYPGDTLLRLDDNKIVVRNENLILSGFDLPQHAYYFNDKRELDFLTDLLTFLNPSHSTIQLADFKRRNASEFMVSSKEDGWVVIKEAFFPYWKVLNKDKEIYKGGPNFMIARIESGETLHFKFIPSPVRKIALAISLVTLGILIFVYYRLRIPKR